MTTQHKVKKKVRFYDDTGRVGVAKDYGVYWKFWEVALGHSTFVDYDSLERFARVQGFTAGNN